MSLVSLLATTTLITLANSAPMVRAADLRPRLPADNDHLLLILLLNRKDLGPKSRPPSELGGAYEISSGFEAYGDGGGDLVGPGSRLEREKRLGSLSIVNSVDVLRDRVLLELARRKAMEDQQQLGENHRVLNTVGKRVARGYAAAAAYRARGKRLARPPTPTPTPTPLNH